MQKRIPGRGNSAVKKTAISPGACILAALLLLTVPLKWLLAAWTAAVFHELCHIAAVHICGGKILAAQIGACGAVMETAPMTAGRELICALAGPFGSLLLVLLFRYMPELAICGCVQGLYNLLPLYPMDGGRALRCVFSFAGGKGERAFQIAQKILWWALSGFLVFVLFRSAAAAALVCFLCFLALHGKSSCKPGRQRVQ